MRVQKRSATLWIAQALLAALFLFAGGMKLVMPAAALTAQLPLPALFLRFIGVAEVLGALGMVLPGLLRIQTQLTPLAGIGLVIIMAGATVTTVLLGQVGPAAIPLAVGMIAGWVAYGGRGWLREAWQGSGRVARRTAKPLGSGSVRRAA